ncbi:hypothetical protein HZC31_06110 [Candidatus Woesearchaeota archaeon]|nr:hypothetical protein [Candidatus Woesearchaeota archaeon]
MSLPEWITIFLKNKDMMKQQILHIEEKGHIVHITFKGDKKQDSFCYEKLGDLHEILAAAKKSDSDPNYSVNVVCYNTTANLQVLIDHWQQFATHQRVMFYFVNPKSLTDIKWIVNPWLHNRIGDEKSLVPGLKSMASMVEEWKG